MVAGAEENKMKLKYSEIWHNAGGLHLRNGKKITPRAKGKSEYRLGNARGSSKLMG